jgi:DNA (cytosine-5)-methyltransferase 1
MALGRSPDIAINHDAVALAMHAVNHPETAHLPHNIWKVDPRRGNRRPAGRAAVGLAGLQALLQGQGRQAGREENPRPRLGGGALGQRGRAARHHPGERRGVRDLGTARRRRQARARTARAQTFKRWIGELRSGSAMRVEWRELRACDYGAPTIRKRLFLIARRDGLPIVWPRRRTAIRSRMRSRPAAQALAHGGRDHRLVAAVPVDLRHAAEIMAEYGLRAVRPLQAGDHGADRQGREALRAGRGKPFIVNLTHHGRADAGSIDDPLATVTGAHRGEKAIVTPFEAVQRGGQADAYGHGRRRADAPGRGLHGAAQLPRAPPRRARAGFDRSSARAQRRALRPSTCCASSAPASARRWMSRREP